MAATQATLGVRLLRASRPAPADQPCALPDQPSASRIAWNANRTLALAVGTHLAVSLPRPIAALTGLCGGQRCFSRFYHHLRDVSGEPDNANAGVETEEHFREVTETQPHQFAKFRKAVQGRSDSTIVESVLTMPG